MTIVTPPTIGTILLDILYHNYLLNPQTRVWGYMLGLWLNFYWCKTLNCLCGGTEFCYEFWQLITPPQVFLKSTCKNTAKTTPPKNLQVKSQDLGKHPHPVSSGFREGIGPFIKMNKNCSSTVHQGGGGGQPRIKSVSRPSTISTSVKHEKKYLGSLKSDIADITHIGGL